MRAQSAATRGNLAAQLHAFPRFSLCHLPTPLERLENLSRKLNLNLYVKRDDQTGLAMGGNKSRKLEFLMGDALAQRADSIITWAGVQSNWCRQTAAAARRVGIHPYLILFKRPGLPAHRDGNRLLDEICGADITVIELAENSPIMKLQQVNEHVDLVAERAKKAGRKPYIAPIGGSMIEGSMQRPLGAIAYANAMLELNGQAQAHGLAIDYLVFASSSGSTHAGLLAGAICLDSKTKIVAISVSDPRKEISEKTASITNQALLEISGDKTMRVRPDEVVALDDYVGEGYGILNRTIVEAMTTVAQNEGMLLDPVYTGKAMVALLDLCKRGYFEPGKNVVFLHTGGTPALFAYSDSILQYLDASSRLHE